MALTPDAIDTFLQVSTPQNHKVSSLCGFLLDNVERIGYNEHMLSGIRIYASDNVWRQILSDFGATVLDASIPGVINFDDLNISESISPLDLKSIILNARDNTDVLYKIFGAHIALPSIQGRIVALLHKSDGMTIGELKSALGYAPDVTTHAMDTAIYQLRQKYGREFIKNTNGVYRLGKL